MCICKYIEKLPSPANRKEGIRELDRFLYELTISGFKELSSIDSSHRLSECNIRLYKHSSKNILVLLRSSNSYASGWVFFVRKSNQNSEKFLNWSSYGNLVYDKAYNGFVKDLVECEDLYEGIEDWSGVMSDVEFKIFLRMSLRGLADSLYKDYILQEDTEIDGGILTNLRELEVALLLKPLHTSVLLSFMCESCAKYLDYIISKNCELSTELKEGYNGSR